MPSSCILPTEPNIRGNRKMQNGVLNHVQNTPYKAELTQHGSVSSSGILYLRPHLSWSETDPNCAETAWEFMGPT